MRLLCPISTASFTQVGPIKPHPSRPSLALIEQSLETKQETPKNNLSAGNHAVSNYHQVSRQSRKRYRNRMFPPRRHPCWTLLVPGLGSCQELQGQRYLALVPTRSRLPRILKGRRALHKLHKPWKSGANSQVIDTNYPGTVTGSDSNAEQRQTMTPSRAGSQVDILEGWPLPQKTRIWPNETGHTRNSNTPHPVIMSINRKLSVSSPIFPHSQH